MFINLQVMKYKLQVIQIQLKVDSLKMTFRLFFVLLLTYKLLTMQRIKQEP